MMLERLQPQIENFLKIMRVQNGYYRYSLTGDLYNNNRFWGLGNAVFALKLYYMIGYKKENRQIKDLFNFIISFQKSNGLIYDNLIHKKALGLNLLISLRNFKFSNIFRADEKRAEARQSFSS